MGYGMHRVDMDITSAASVAKQQIQISINMM